MPGVDVTTATRSGPSAPVLAQTGQAFFAGMADRGPTTIPVLVNGVADFESWFGGRVTYSHLYDTVKTFFEEGGSQCYVARVVGDTPTKGTITAKDRAGSPLDTVQFEASGPGAYSGNIDVAVAAGTVANSVTITVMDGTDAVEVYYNLTSPAAIAAAFTNSRYVHAIDKGSATAAPNNLPALDTYSLSSGTDDRATADATNYETALDLFGIALGPGAVSIPGVGTTVHSTLIDHAEANNRVAILSMDVDDTINDLTTQAGLLNSEYAGLFAPWVKVVSSGVSTISIPPDGFVAAARNRAHSTTGPWRAGAGEISSARAVVGVAVSYTAAEGNQLDVAKVNVVRIVGGRVRVYGWRSLSNDVENFSFLTSRDMLNALIYDAEQALEQYVFMPIDGKGHLLASVQGALVGVLEPIRQQGGVFEQYTTAGEMIDPGYLVETGSNVNTLENLANNEIKARVSVRLAPSAALISVTIVKVGLLSNL